MGKKRIKIIMDTSVLYAGLYSKNGASYRILKAIYDRKIVLVLSTTLLFEYEDILKRNQAVLNLSNHEIEILLDNLCKLSEYQKVHFLWRPYLPDPKDDHILELAVASGIEIIVTHNIKDFSGAEKFGINVITPRKLLEVIK